MTVNSKLGGWLAIIAAGMGIVGHFFLFSNWYQIGMAAEAAEPGCEILLKYLHPLLTDFGLLGGVLFAVSAYGFFTNRNWAFLVSVIALVPALLGSWFVNVPFMAAGLPPVTTISPVEVFPLPVTWRFFHLSRSAVVRNGILGAFSRSLTRYCITRSCGALERGGGRAIQEMAFRIASPMPPIC